MNCKRTHIPTQTIYTFNILDNYEFKKTYNHMNKAKFIDYAQILVDKWNSRLCQREQTYIYELIPN